ncbi:replicative DNA helicase [Halalkalibacter sp. APA_J-10(15)]|uniref:replicative DNA helicase n=1 Tax=Halalkalibacter sp. APA_J-10(15) TaxID=2933805 RepID=UPI001FF186BB|nr:replicative DNA helicase [Halalkalibacter sp. APA_J-10(15)]MCK0471419.1 replicative DNA helicase [Halalkalibacter sp. APA_J-10(15)]
MNHFAKEAEQAVIGAILIEPELIKETAIQPEQFYDPKHQIIFNTMRDLEMREKPCDIVGVITALEQTLSQIGGVDYISSLSNAVATTANFNYHNDLVLESYRIRTASKLALSFNDNASDEGITDLINQLQEVQDSTIRKKQRSKLEILADIAESMNTEVKGLTGCTTGIVDLDRMTGGWQKQDLIIVAARPSVGKTAFALNMGSAHCKQNGVTTIFSLEMSDVQLVKRLLSAEGNVDGHKWRNPHRWFSSSDYQKATNAIGTMEKWDIEIIDDVGINTNDIRSHMMSIMRKYPDRDHLVIIDYLQLIRSSKKRSENRQQEVSEISRNLKALARELNIPVIALSQLSRGVESRQDKRPMLSDIRESGSIEQDADVVAFLYRDDYYDKESESQNIIEIILSKQRNGAVGTTEAAFIKEYSKFVNLDRKYSNAQGG